MKANEFVKRFGWDEVESKVDEGLFLSAEFFEFLGHVVNVDELSNLIRSHKIVQAYGSLDDAKKSLSKKSMLRWIDPETELLRQAIADVESCQ